MELDQQSWNRKIPPSKDYYEDNWKNYSPDLLKSCNLEKYKISLNEVFYPIRDPIYVNAEFSSKQETTFEKLRISQCFICSLCNENFKDPVITSKCAHRFCTSCILKWIQMKNKNCPTCGTSIANKKSLQKDYTIQMIIDQLLLSKTENKNFLCRPKQDNLIGNGFYANPSFQQNDFLGLNDSESDSMVNDNELIKTGHNYNKNLNTKNYSDHLKNESDEFSADYNDDNFTEFFLVCLNNNLPGSISLIFRELSKRPLKLPFESSLYDAAIIIARKVVKALPGAGDLQFIIRNINFVRDGEHFPAVPNIKINEVSRNVTEGKGPNVVRYLLTDSLYIKCCSQANNNN